MIPNNFEYFAPKTIEEALKFVDKYGEDCKILSGGHSLIPVLKLRLAAPAVIVDVGRIEGLKTIEVDDGAIRIGGGVTHAQIAADAELKRHCPLLCETASQIGDQQVRNRGTIGGSLTPADPAADWPAAILALDAEVVLTSKNGERIVKAEDFFVAMLQTAVEEGEILTLIKAPVTTGEKTAYLKVAQSASGFAVCGVAARLQIGSGNSCD